EANLEGANLVGANLGGADLRGANLLGALTRVNDFVVDSITDPVITELNEADRAALAQDADLCGSRYDQQTQWPDMFEIPTCAILVE
ncbi:MAG: pentapeptide repeat-containing protein, partial [Anaerolineae bacterium]|nr:pentapeptide repeat-containing protein [Anaerolineae bacterium]